jgi:hypothetical protein
MKSRYLPVLVLVSILIPAVALLQFWFPHGFPGAATTRGGPETMEEVIANAEQLGLHWRRDGPDYCTYSNRVIVSELPLSQDRCSLLVVSTSDLSDWTGKVAVYRADLFAVFESDHPTFWGSMVLYGDPALIKKLTGRIATDGAKAN